MKLKSMETTLQCHKIIGTHVEGKALVSHESTCFYLTDPKTVVIREKTHELEEKALSKKCSYSRREKLVQWFRLTDCLNSCSAILLQKP